MRFTLCTTGAPFMLDRYPRFQRNYYLKREPHSHHCGNNEQNVTLKSLVQTLIVLCYICYLISFLFSALAELPSMIKKKKKKADYESFTASRYLNLFPLGFRNHSHLPAFVNSIALRKFDLIILTLLFIMRIA